MAIHSMDVLDWLCKAAQGRRRGVVLSEGIIRAPFGCLRVDF